MTVIKKPMACPARRGTIYPPPFDQGFEKREKRALTALLGLTQFGVNITTLAPGGISAHRHWHAKEDEFIYVLSGQLVLRTDDGEEVLTAGMAAGFAAGVPNGHQLVNTGTEPAVYLEVGTRSLDEDVVYSDLDLAASKRDGEMRFFRKNGEPLP